MDFSGRCEKQKMIAMNKKDLSEQDIRTKYITLALDRAGWDLFEQVREEVTFTDGRIYVRGKLHTRGEKKRADYILLLQTEHTHRHC